MHLRLQAAARTPQAAVRTPQVARDTAVRMPQAARDTAVRQARPRGILARLVTGPPPKPRRRRQASPREIRDPRRPPRGPDSRPQKEITKRKVLFTQRYPRRRRA